MQTLTDFLTNPAHTQEAKCIELLKHFYSGFLTISEYHDIVKTHLGADLTVMANVEKLLDENSSMLPTAKEGYVTCLAGMQDRKFIFDIEEAKELSGSTNYYDSWKLRMVAPQGYAVKFVNEEMGVSAEMNYYCIKAYEEYALNRIKNNLVTRTTTKIALVDRELSDLDDVEPEDRIAELVEDVVTIFPDMTETELAEATHAVTSIDGGFSYTAIAELVRLEDVIRTKYHCPARKAFVVRSFISEVADAEELD